MITLGTIFGHSLCTLVAVLGGRWLATKISVKQGVCAHDAVHVIYDLTGITVTLGGAALFLVFGAVYTYEAIYFSEAAIDMDMVASV
jgi:putative Ca2+/H+ antiporter (TMEM165/GDT1 family)